MGKEKTVSTGGMFQEMFNLGIYKRSQGRISRQVTCAVIWITFALAAWRLFDELVVLAGDWRYVIAASALLIGIWLGYRLVNVPRFADFLIAVEAEMNKVSWPARGELVRSSVVVILVIFLLAGVLFGFDLMWQFLFKLIGVRR